MNEKLEITEDYILPIIGDIENQKKVLKAWQFIDIDHPLQSRKELMSSLIQNKTPFWNIHVGLAFIASRMKPESYLEIGVRTCGSMVQVIHNSTCKKIVGLDLWTGSYSGFVNTIEYAKMQMENYRKRSGRQFHLNFIQGNSHVILKELIRKEEKYDLITVDGDHTEEGAYQDLNDALRLLNNTGAIVFDDIIHVSHKYLLDVANRIRLMYPNLVALMNTKQDNGCVIFLRNIDLNSLLR